MLNLLLRRDTFTPECTLGKLYLVGEKLQFIERTYHLCETLEDPVRSIRDVKIEGETAIPTGRYPVTITWSPKFQKFLPILSGVPGYTGVRIHRGNTADDTRGCILLGIKRETNKIIQSGIAFTIVENLLKQELNIGGECFIEISNDLLAS